MIKTKEFRIDTFKAHITFCVGEIEDVKKHFDKKFDCDIDVSIFYNTNGSAFKIKNGRELATRVFWVRVFDKECHDDIARVAHEASHMAFQIMEDKGVPTRIENEEVHAYLVDYIVRSFLKYFAK